MRLQSLLSTLFLPLVLATNFTRSSKRGLINIASKTLATDQNIWVEPGSDLTWYYNYSPNPSANISNSLEFVPMLFSSSATGFADTIRALIKSGTNITHVLSYNEPDGSTSTGGSNVKATDAAATWKTELEPLRELGIELGAPAVTGSSRGLEWLKSFFEACDGGCTADFMPMHWYGDFDGLSSQMGQVRQAYSNLTLWITEYALPNAALNDTQSFFNTSTEYFDRLDYVDRYSYFGSFRSDVSNVGKNVAMLNQDGKLTDIGSWYLGGAATNNIPKGGAGTVVISRLWGGLVLGLCLFMV